MQHTQYKIAVITNGGKQTMDDLTATTHDHGVVFDKITHKTLSLTNLAESDFVKTLLQYDIVYYRTGLKGAALSELAHILQTHNVPTINCFPNHQYIHEKSRQATLAGRFGIKHPETILGPTTYETIATTIGTPFVAKPITGAQGTGVTLVSSQAELETVRTEQKHKPLIYQAYMEGAEEYRVYTLGNRGITSYKKVPSEKDFRANLHVGGSMHPTEPERKAALLAFAAKVATAFDVDISGVDVLLKDDELYLLEINTQPGWENLDQVSQQDLTTQTVQFILDRAHAWHTKT